MVTDEELANDTAVDGDCQLEDLAAALTLAAYPLLLRCGLTASWVRVQLALWQAMRGAVNEWGRKRPAPGSVEQFRAWRAAFVADLTFRTLSVARQGGINGSMSGLATALPQTCRLALRRHDEVSFQFPGNAPA